MSEEFTELKRIFHLRKLGNKAKEDALLKCIKEWYKDVVYKDCDLAQDYLSDKDMEDFSKYCGIRANQRYKWIMFTINFKDDEWNDDKTAKIIKYMKKKWIKESWSCIEWRDGNKGMHMHSKVEIDEEKNPYECKREVYNTFKHLVGNKMHVNARYSNREGCFDEYIRGYKMKDTKPNYVMDKELRRELGISDILEDEWHPRI